METPPGLRPTFDTERFIREVRIRAILWDNMTPTYGDKVKKNQCWEELGSMFIPGWDGMSVDEQQLLVRSLQKRWKNLRDCFKKELNAVKSKSASKRKRPYIFFKHMKFLIPVTENNETPAATTHPDPLPVIPQPNAESNEEAAEESNHKPVTTICELPTSKRPLPLPEDPDEDDQPKTKKQKKFENQLLDVLSKNVNGRQITAIGEDEDKLFLLSLVNELKKVPENRKLEVKMEMMRCIQKAQRHSSHTEEEYINSPDDTNSGYVHLIEVKREDEIIKEEIVLNSDDDD